MVRFLRNSAHLAYGLYATTAFSAVALSALVAVAVTPRMEWRRQVVRGAAATVFRLAGAAIQVRGLHHIPETGCVVVANHASYLDGIILTAALPPRFGFVIKREVTRVPGVHYLLRRIGSHFVERFDPHRSGRDARRLLARARQEALAFFPEGTFGPEPGLRRFHNGAFAAALHGDVPVVPVVIRGSRAMLPAQRLLPRPGRLEVIVKPPVDRNPEDPLRSLLEGARRSILEDLDEPDLLA
jgi:1-acyl-sn-glycerol-3-phosphate acyltransferase